MRVEPYNDGPSDFIVDESANIKTLSLENQFLPTNFIKDAYVQIRGEFPNISPEILEPIVESALEEILPFIHSHVFFYDGVITVDGEAYQAIITPHEHNHSSKQLQGHNYHNNYSVMLRSLRDDTVATRVIDFPKEEVAEISRTILERLAKALRNSRASKGVLTYDNYTVCRLFDGTESLGYYYGRNRDTTGFRVTTAQDIVSKFLERAGMDLPAYVELPDSSKEYLKKELGKVLAKDVLDQRNKAWLSFYGGLKADVINFMASLKEIRIEFYNYFVTSDRSEQVMDFRRGAVEVAQRIGQRLEEWPAANARKFWKIVDAGQSVITAFSQAFTLPEATVRKMIRDFEHRSKNKGDFLHKFLIKCGGYQGLGRLFSYQPHLPFPRDFQEWEDFKHIAEFATYIGTPTPNHRHNWHIYHRGFNRQTAELMQKLWKSKRNAQGWADFRALYQGEHEHPDKLVGDMLSSMYDQVIAPILLRMNPDEAFACQLIVEGGIQDQILRQLRRMYDIPQAINASDYWHENYAQYPRGVPVSSDPNPTWLPLVEEIKTPDGIIIRPLTSKTELEEEGADDAMHHCVGGYSWRCESGSNYIFSVRDANGNRLSTLQLVDHSKKGEAFQVKISQNKAYKNRPPSTEAVKAAEWLKEQINTGSLKTNIAEIRTICVANKANGELAQLEAKVGFDYNDETMCEEVRKLYTRCLPPKIRATVHNVDDFLSVTGIDNILNKNGLRIPSRGSEKLATGVNLDHARVA